MKINLGEGTLMKKRLLSKRIFVAVLILCVMAFNFSACTFIERLLGKTEKVGATVIEIDKYGHAVLDITTAGLIEKGYDLGDVVCVSFDSYELEMPFFDGYYTAPDTLMMIGKAPERNISLCINYGDFSEEMGIEVGERVEIAMVEKAGMLAFQELCALKYSNDRADYPSDAAFANFREVSLGRIGAGKLYRMASPVNNENGRAPYANSFIESLNIATVVNLADSVEDVEAYFGEEGFSSEYYRALYDRGDVIVLDMAANFKSDEFASSVVEGLRFILENEPPYCIHCTEGKDRTGFMSMVLAALMGAELEEIIDDYMLSFYNYFGIDEKTQPQRYEAVLNNNLIAMLCQVAGASSVAELEHTDLERAVTQYLFNAGMSEEEILTLKEKLS